MKCYICNVECKNYMSLSKHIRKHDISSQSYYNIYIKKDTEGYCLVCNKSTRFISLGNGYKQYCCNRCAGIGNTSKREQKCLKKYGVKNPTQNQQIKEKISNTTKSEECKLKSKNIRIAKYGTYLNIEKVNNTKKERYGEDYNSIIAKKSQETRKKRSNQYEKEHNCTSIGKLISKYGQGWLSIKDQLNIIQLNGYTYILNDEIYKIEEYQNHTSKVEQSFINLVSQYYNPIIHSRSIISPYELDIYIKELNLAIEFNGTLFHSIEHNKDIYYHLNKSLRCRELNIRLIHIYEFEDLEYQKQLLQELFLGKDNYPKEDFNKNNLLDLIPEPILIYTSNRNYHIYGAGKLY